MEQNCQISAEEGKNGATDVSARRHLCQTLSRCRYTFWLLHSSLHH